MSEQNAQRVNRDSSWLRHAATAEDQFPSISVGGLAASLGLYPDHAVETPRMFGELINLLRRKAEMSVSQLARLGNVEEIEIERAERNLPVDRNFVLKIASALKLPPEKLAQLAGVSKPQDPSLFTAAKKLETQLHQLAHPLTPGEESALGDFMSVLN